MAAFNSQNNPSKFTCHKVCEFFFYFIYQNTLKQQTNNKYWRRIMPPTKVKWNLIFIKHIKRPKKGSRLVPAKGQSQNHYISIYLHTYAYTIIFTHFYCWSIWSERRRRCFTLIRGTNRIFFLAAWKTLQARRIINVYGDTQ